MADIFLKIVNMSISASWIVLAVLLLRLLLKKAPKWINGILWGIVGLRLIMPFSLESIFSLIPSGETISKAPNAPRPHFESGVTIIDNQVNDYLGGHYYEGVTRPTGHFADITTILAIVWIVGIVVLLGYTIISYLRVKNKIGTAILLRDNIYQSENVVSPFVLGIIKPKIYLPFNMNEQDMNHVIAHENAHIRRKDHWWKPFGFCVLTLHWFNPLMWLGYVLLCRDIELACDEKVVKEFNNEQKADYSQALLTCSVNRRIIAACPLAFGEAGVKDRVKSVLNYKKPAFWIVVIAIIASIAVAVCFLTNPTSNKLKNIENSSSIPTSKETIVWVSNGSNYQAIGSVSTDLLEALSEIKISRKEISLSRDENRDKSHTIVLQTKKDATPTIYSYLKGLYIHFNTDFTSVWVNDGVKPTLSYRVINPQKAKQIYEDIANFSGAEKLTWSYNPSLSHTSHYTRAFAFDCEYTHVDATCTGGEFWNLEVEGQPRDTNMRFEKGKTVYWTPGEGDGKSSDKAEVTLTVYNGETKVQQHTVIFECVSRNYSVGEYEFYLKDTTEFVLVYSEEGYLKFIEGNSISNVGGADSSNVQTFESTVSYANWSDDSKIYIEALNTDKMSIDSVQHLPIYKFDTLTELEQFKQSFGNIYTIDRGWDEVQSFNNVTAKYDNTFFEENSLVLVYVGTGNSTHRFKMQNVGYDDKSFYVHVVETTNAEFVDNAMAGWFVTVAVSDDLLKTVTSFDADLNNAIDMSLPKYEGDKVIDVPPTLVVVSNGQSIEALKGTSSWIREGTNGMSEAVMSDSGHPLMMKKSMPSIDILPVHYATIGDPLQAKIQFNAKGVTPVYEVPPDEIHIRCWEEKHWGKTNAKSENINPTIVNGNVFFDLKDGNYIYEVVATWSSQDKFSGTVRYSFYTLKSDASSNMD